MCGRFAQHRSPGALGEFLRAQVAPEPDWRPRYNVAPSTPVLALALRNGVRRLDRYRWGLVPAWSKTARSTYATFNARAETVATAPAFRAAYRRRRCVVPADGWYEWQTRDGAKRPWYLYRADGAPLLFAGLWEYWESEGAEPLESCTIIVTAASASLASIHDRMPVILEPEQLDLWLDPQAPRDAVDALLRPAADGVIGAHPVAPRVNNVRNDDPSCVEPLAPA